MTTQPAQIAPQRLDLPREPWSLRDVSILEINLTDLEHNMTVLRRTVGKDCELCPIVKADAYGLGASRIGKRLAFAGADMLAVYTPEQCGELLRCAVGCRVLVLMPVREIARVDEIYRGLIADKVHLTVHDVEHAHDLIAITERYGLTLRVHLEVDTGMSRGGCGVREAAQAIELIASCRRLVLAGIFTHFSNAEGDVALTSRQMADFERLLEEQAARIPSDCCIHAANTFATLRHSRFHHSMVRVGLGWAGYAIECMTDGEVLPEALELHPVVTWKSRIVQVKSIEPGTPVGYGSRWRANRPTILGLVPVGYADGYPLSLGRTESRPSGSVVAVFDRAPSGETHERGGIIGYAPVVGAVNMDQLTIDLTELMTKSGGEISRFMGGIVELISPNPKAPNHLPTLAKIAGTIPHQLLTGLSARVTRRYVAPVNPAEHIPHASFPNRREKALA